MYINDSVKAANNIEAIPEGLKDITPFWNMIRIVPMNEHRSHGNVFIWNGIFKKTDDRNILISGYM
jgi:hypothetical protein